MSKANSPVKLHSGFGWGVIYGTVAPLLIATYAQMVSQAPLHQVTRSGDMQLNHRVLGGMMLSIPIGALLGTLHRNVVPQRLASYVGIWILSSLASYVLLFQEVLWLAFIDVRIVDFLVVGCALVWVFVSKIRNIRRGNRY